MGFDAASVRLDFPILSRTFEGKPLVYLDSASTSQKPTAVIEAEADFYRLHNANAHRGIYTLGEEATELFEQARSTIAGFFGVERSCAARLHPRHHGVDQPRRARMGPGARA